MSKVVVYEMILNVFYIKKLTVSMNLVAYNVDFIVVIMKSS